MSEYRICRRTQSGRIIGSFDVRCRGDQAALTLAINSLKPGVQAEVWHGHAFIGAAALPKPLRNKRS
ncbi:MAG TPA: hypothetical protein VMB71_16555 [Acetobacteraceae bacterium]|nr:hypothetical protein [Acetobacteraceae bacterium]